jgi:hypothetical protein
MTHRGFARSFQSQILRAERVSQARNQHEAGDKQCLLNAGFLLDFLLSPEDGSDMFLRNIY